MNERSPGLVGAIAAGRPVLASAVIALGLCALAAVGFDRASVSFNGAATAFVAALLIATVFPAAIASIAPKGFWLRLLYSGFAAGLLLAVRRLLLQWEWSFGPFDAGLALAVAASATFLLALFAPLWRATLSFSLVGLLAMVLGVSGGLALAAIESAAGAPTMIGASLAVAAGGGAALSVQIAAFFPRFFAENGGNEDAAALAARHGAAPALFLLVIGVAGVFAAGFSEQAVLAETLADSRIALAAIGFAVAAPLIMGPGGLSLKAQTEITAVVENRRRAALAPFLKSVRNILPPSSALAASAILVIIGIVAAFESGLPAAAPDLAAAAAVFVVGAVLFVSLRTGLLAAVFVIVAGQTVNWIAGLAGVAALTEKARIVAAILGAALSMQLFLAWRDRRDLRRKTREVVRVALADSLCAYVAASTLAVAAIAATEAAGLWSEGGETALLTAGYALFGLFAAPPLMTAVGALFGRR